ncbi:MAG: C1 family peptidase [Candidatus Aenigmatarchaeota archaeon]
MRLVSAALILIIVFTTVAFAQDDTEVIYDDNSDISVENTINHINEIISEKSLDWIAGKTSMSNLSKEERRARLVPIRQTDKSTASPLEFIRESYPSSLDWRNKDGKNWVTPVKDQDGCGSCWAFSAVGVVESRINIALNNPDYDIDLSEQDVVSCSGTGSCSGGLEGNALSYMKSSGTVIETCFPYAAADSSCSDKCSNGQLVKVLDYNAIPASADAIKQAVSDYGPVTAYMAVFTDFYFYNNGTYTSVWGDYEGTHAISIVGYNDAEEYWICKNSWGINWGESGFFRIAYSENVFDYNAWLNDPNDFRTLFLDESYAVTSTDIDNDNVADESDNCPYTANADQTDNDGDRIGNVCDTDIDGDGLGNENDNCPNNANSWQEDNDNDGLGDVCDDDDDNDSITADNDACPFTLGIAYYKGCPDTIPPIISFGAPTPENNSVTINNKETINVSVIDASGIASCTLEWNGMNESMIKATGYCYSTKNTTDGLNYTFRVYVNDSYGSVNATDRRAFTESSTTFIVDVNYKASLCMYNETQVIGFKSKNITEAYATIILPDAANITVNCSSSECDHYTPLDPGNYSFFITIKNSLNNTNTSEIYNFTALLREPEIYYFDLSSAYSTYYMIFLNASDTETFTINPKICIEGSVDVNDVNVTINGVTFVNFSNPPIYDTGALRCYGGCHPLPVGSGCTSEDIEKTKVNFNLSSFLFEHNISLNKEFNITIKIKDKYSEVTENILTKIWNWSDIKQMEYYQFDNDTVVINSTKTNIFIKIKLNSSVLNPYITVIFLTNNPTQVNFSYNLNYYYEIFPTQSVRENLDWMLIKIYYNKSDITVNESDLRLYWFNESIGQWQAVINSTVNETEGYVWANLTHFSYFSIQQKYCGDGICDSGETCSLCSQDCGTCSPSCGDGSCNNGETCSSCSNDCGSCPVQQTGGGGGGGGGGFLQACKENWTCNDWSICIDGNQSRTCIDNNKCGTMKNKPAENQSCVVEKPSTEQTKNLTKNITEIVTEKNTTEVIRTVSPTGFAALSPTDLAVGGTVIAILVVAGILYWKRKILFKKKKY